MNETPIELTEVTEEALVVNEVVEDNSQTGDDFGQSVDVMWKGMTAIFVVILAIVLLVVVLNKVTSKKKAEK